MTALIAGFCALRPIADPDLPWHLHQAKTVLELGPNPYADQTSFTLPGKTFHHTWLGALLLLAIFNLGGFAAISWYLAVGAAAIVASASWAAWVFSEGRKWTTVIVSAMIGGLAAWRIGPRPLVFFLVFLPIALVLARRFAHAPPAGHRRYGVALIGLQTAWTLLHASFILLPAIVGIALLDRAKRDNLRLVARRAAVFVPMLLVIFGLSDIGRHLEIVGDHALGDSTRFISEMRPFGIGEFFPAGFQPILFVYFLLGLGIVRLVQNRRLRIGPLLYAGLGLALTLTAVRFQAAWGLLCIPFAATPVIGHQETRLLKLSAVCAMLLCAPLALTDKIADDPIRGYGIGAAPDQRFYPKDAADFLRRHDVSGKLLNRYGDGGYLSFRLYPQVRIAIDGRTPTLFDAQLHFLLRSLQKSPTAFQAFDNTYRPDMALVPIGWPLCGLLSDRAQWRAVFLDGARALFFRSGFREDVLGLMALPTCSNEWPIDEFCRDVPEREADLERLRQDVPDAMFGAMASGFLAGACRGDAETALLWSRKAIDTGTQEPYAWYLHGAALAGAARPDDAIEALKRSLSYGRRLDAASLLGTLLVEQGQYTLAIEHYESMVEAYLDRLPWRERLQLAKALLAVGRAEQARFHAQRAFWISGSPEAAKIVQQTQGRALHP